MGKRRFKETLAKQEDKDNSNRTCKITIERVWSGPEIYGQECVHVKEKEGEKVRAGIEAEGNPETLNESLVMQQTGDRAG